MFGWLKKREVVEAPQSVAGANFPNALAGDIDLFFISPNTRAEKVVTADTALTCVPFWACVNFLSTSIAKLPLRVFSRTREGKDPQDGDPVSAVVGRAWNPQQTKYEALRWMVQQTCLHGVSYAQIFRDGRGNPINIFPLERGSVSVTRTPEGEKVYRYSPVQIGDRPQPMSIIPAADIVEIPFMEGGNLLEIISPVAKCKDAIGLHLALEAHASNIFKNGGIPPVLLKTPKHTSPQALVRAQKNLEAAFRSRQKRGALASVLPPEYDVVNFAFKPTDSQMIDARRYATEEICRIFAVPPIFVQDLSKGTYNNSAQQDVQFVKHTLSRWATQIETHLSMKLFGRGSDRFVEFDLRSVERGSFTERIGGYTQMIQSGIATPNEVREWETLPPSDSENANALMIQGATMPLDMAGAQQEAAAKASEAKANAPAPAPAAKPPANSAPAKK